ncbi:hypothetical protein ATJ97_0749 [Georgenia soli]|uniref:Uncharacterized protein n=1 Tax=Georgenia soli TaxID=638953 RepID=A0A2A9EI48_9MICO|nr:hypothetical protein [Georgenia soli]PFG38276.1 hypothetical protein ATJ97_0749 [Georgenia soli]
MDNDVHNSFPPPTAADRVDDVDISDDGAAATGRMRSRRSRLAPPAADERVELPRRDYLPWVVMGVLMGMAVAVYFLL